MKNLLSPVAKFVREEEGASAVEYVILAALIAAVIVAITVSVGYQVERMYNKLCQEIKNLPNASCG